MSQPTLLLPALLMLALGLPGGAGAETRTPEEPARPPPFLLLRAEEDYRYLRDPDVPRAPLDALKFIPLAPGGVVFLSLGGETRQWVHVFRHPGLAEVPAGDVVYLQRYMLHADLNLWDRVRTFFQLKSGVSLGRYGGAGPTEQDWLDVHQAFVEVRPWERGDERFLVRVGRQELQFGSVRLLFVREGANVRRTFDGVLARVKSHQWLINTFAMLPVSTEPGVFDDSPVLTQGFWGLYTLHPLPVLRGGKADLYYLGNSYAQARYAQGEGREQRHSFGTRLWGTSPPWDYNVELVLQVGRFAGAPLLAWLAAGDTGFTFEHLPLSPRLGLSVDVASGDPSLEDPSLHTFNPLYTRAAHLGDLPIVGLYNCKALQTTLRLQPIRATTLSLEWIGTWRQSAADGIYGPGGGLVRPANVGGSLWLGSQVNLIATWELNRHVFVYTSAAHFFAGTTLRETGGVPSADFLQGFVSLRF